MAAAGTPRARSDVHRYYQAFSAQVGLVDWLRPNPRHEQLKLIVDRLLRDRRVERILDIGCGAGVMSDHLCRYAPVTGVDLSVPAVRLGQLVGRADLETTPIAELDGEFDLVTLFDVLEHVPVEERRGFVASVTALVAADGLVIVSTPHPSFTRWLRRHRPDAMQVVDEEVDPVDVISLAAEHELSLVHYETYDVDRSCQYQLFALRRGRQPGSDPETRCELRRRMLLVANPLGRLTRRARVAARLVRRRRWAIALGFILPRRWGAERVARALATGEAAQGRTRRSARAPRSR